jgi:TolA-binding protein
MKHRMRVGAFALAFLILGSSVSAQMNMLPQLFRDLPPELQDGLPETMAYEEYLNMTRNVDFFSMFMAIWVPGYALFGVDEPALGWGVASVRGLGLGMILTGFGRQWRDLNDLWNLSTITNAEDRYERAVQNLILVGGGFFLNGIAWAFDVSVAYRIAQNDKSLVQYKYGKLARYDGTIQDKQESYIRSLARQEGGIVEEDLERSIRLYLRRYPESSFVGEAEYQLGALLAEQERDAEAVIVLLRQMAVHPDPRLSPASRRTAALLVQRNRGEWERDRERLLELVAAARTADTGADIGTADSSRERRFELFLNGIEKLEAEVFQEIYIEEAQAFLDQYPASPIADRILMSQARSYERLGRREDAVLTYTTLAATYPASDLWPEAMLRIGENLAELGERGYAERFYERLLSRAPQSEEAETARAYLDTGAGE